MGKHQDVTRDAYRLLGQPPHREVVPREPAVSGRWLCHDYPDPRARWSQHAEHEIHLVQKSSGRFAVGDYVGAFEPGNLVLIGSNVPHAWISPLAPGQTIPERDIVFQLAPEWVSEIELIVPELHDLRELLSQAHPATQFLGATALRARQELVHIGASTGLPRFTHIVTLLNLLREAPAGERKRLSAGLIPQIDGSAASRAVEAALAYIFDNLTGPVRLSTAAEMAGMSQSAFSKHFRRAAGTTFSAMVQRYRLELACRLLSLTTTPVAAIAHEVGFTNLSNFNRQFRAAFALTPSDYRARETADRRPPEPLPYKRDW